MTQEEKDLLLKDLFARLPYGVKCKDQYGEYINVNIYNAHIEHLIDQILSGVVKIVLRPISSMTEEEKRHIYKMVCLRTYGDGVVHDMTYPVYTPYYVMEDCLSYLRSVHMDYSGLVEKGLALKAKEGMYD